MLLLVLSAPSGPEAIRQAAAATALSLAEVRNRLQGVLPRVLVSDADADRLAEVAGQLEEAGFSTVVCDPRAAPGDDERVVARTLRLEDDALVAIDGAETEHACPWPAVAAVQRAVRTAVHVTRETTTQRKLDVTRAVLSGGLVLTRKEEKVTERKTETPEALLLVQRGDGEPDVIIYERRLDYRFLGRQMQPASRPNLESLLSRLRAACPQARFDDRAARPGFVSSLPATSADPVDLALFVITLAIAAA